jgi:hypothetical protein
MTQLFANNATTTLASAIASTATSITVASGTGALFPNPSSPDYFLATLATLNASGVETVREIVKCTARSSDTLTVVRAQEGTAASAFNAGDKVELRMTAGSFSNFAQSQNVVSSFNTRTGAVTLASADVTGALGFTPVSQVLTDALYPRLIDTGASIDLNTLVNPGMYRTNGTVTNGPPWSTATYSQVLVVRGASDTVWQMIVDWTNSYVSYRVGNPPPIGPGSWKAWNFFNTSASENISFANPGYYKHTNGLILQWGKIGPLGAGTGLGPYSFATTFPNAAISVVASGEGSNQVEVTAGSITTSNFKVTISAGSSVYIHWISTGY